MPGDLFQGMRNEGEASLSQPADDPVFFGTSSFSELDWVGPFYPSGTSPADFLSYYATQFHTVEIDATYYAVPTAKTVDGWRERTPAHFLFSAKFPRAVVHGGEGSQPDTTNILDSQRALEVTETYLAAISRLGEKLGMLLIQFPYFNKIAFKQSGPFLERLDRFLNRLPEGYRYAVEIRNRTWLNETFVEVVRAHGCVLALVDHAWMPHGAEIAEQLGALTNGLGYVRLVGDRAEIEKITSRWNREVLDKEESLLRWARLLASVSRSAEKIVVYVNNHFTGYSPATARRLMQMYYKELDG
ncbi:MAG: DUF72 domain-containing protein [bacterium]